MNTETIPQGENTTNLDAENVKNDDQPIVQAIQTIETNENSNNSAELPINKIILEPIVQKPAPIDTSNIGTMSNTEESNANKPEKSKDEFLSPEKLAIYRKKNQMTFRIFFFAANLMIVFLLYLAISFTFYLRVTYRIDVTSMLTLEINGCNIEVLKCEASNYDCNPQEINGEMLESGYIEVKYATLHVDHQAVYRQNTNGAITEHLIIDNESTCSTYPKMNCDKICKIQVFLPSYTSTDFFLKVIQSKDDSHEDVQIDMENVQINRLDIKGVNVQTKIKNSVIKKAKIMTSTGSIFSEYSDIEDATFKTSESNIYVFSNSNISDTLNILHRTTSSSSCLKTTRENNLSSRVSLDPDGVWSECNMDPTNGIYAAKYLNQYDTDENRRITESEFVEGLESLNKCCGSSCPVKNKCAKSLKYTYVPVSAAYVSGEDFIDTVVAENDTTLVPGCHRKATIHTSKNEKSNKIRAWTDYGRVFIKHDDLNYDDSNNSNYSDFVTTYGNANENDEVLLAQGDTERIITEIQKKYGQGITSTQDNLKDSTGLSTEWIYAVFIVESAPGIPSAKFIFTNNPIFLTLEPATLGALSGGLLVPNIVQMHIQFINQGCSIEDFDSSLEGTVKLNREVSMASQLFKVLQPFSRSSLWGELVLVGENHAVEFPQLYRFIRDSSTLELSRARFNPNSLGKACLYISFSLGIFGAVSLLTIFKDKMKEVLLSKIKNEKVKKKLFAESKSSKDVDGDENEDGLKNDVDEVEEGEGGFINPFERPIDLCNELFVFPFRRSHSNSLRSFLLRRCTGVIKKEQSRSPVRSSVAWISKKVMPAKEEDGKDGGWLMQNSKLRLENAISMSEFITKYDKFCFNLYYDMEEDISVIKGELVKIYQARTRSYIDDRLIGIKWNEKIRENINVCNEKTPRSIPESVKFTDFVSFAELSKLDAENAEEWNQKLCGMFIDNFCEVTEISSHYLSYDTVQVITSDGPEKGFGFRDAYQIFAMEYLKYQGKEETLSKSDIFIEEKTLIGAGVHRETVKIDTIPGIKWKKYGDPVNYSWQWYFIQYMAVVIHQTVFMIPPMVVVYISFQIQNMFAITSSPIDIDPLTMEDLMYLRRFPGDLMSFEILDSFRIAILFSIAVLDFCYLMLLINYVDVYLPHCVTIFRQQSFKIALSLCFFFLLSFTLSAASWVLLAAFLRPEKYLPYGTAIITFFTVLAHNYNRTVKAAKTLKGAIKDRIHSQIRKKIIKAIELHKKRNPVPESEIMPEEDIDEATDEVFDPNDIFMIIDQKGKGKADNYLTKEEFHEIFDWLQLSIAPAKRDMMFAYCDSEGDDKISREEFLEAWDWLEKSIFDSVAAGIGLSDSQQILSVLSLAMMLIAVIIFLFLALNAFTTNGGFVSTVQSVGIAFAGAVSAETKKKPKGENIAENKEALQKFVSNVV